MDRKRVLYALVVVGFVLRLLLSLHQTAHADEMIINWRAIDIISAGRISTVDQMPLWHWWLDALYQIFGVGFFAARLGAVVFGSLLPVLVYLLGRTWFDDRVSLSAAVLTTFSPWILLYQPESDTTMAFFFLLASVLFFRGLKRKDLSWMLGGFALLGLATLIKTIALMGLPVFLLCWWLQRKRVPLFGAVYGVLLYGVMVLPIAAYNLILYAKKGYLDMLFIRYFPVPVNPYGQILHGGGLGVGKVMMNLWDFILLFTRTDPLLFVLAFGGLIWWGYRWWQKRDDSYQVFLLGLVLTLFLLDSSLMAKHYIASLCLLSLFGGYALDLVIKNKKHLVWALVVVACFSLFVIWQSYAPDHVVGMEKLSHEIPPGSLVVADNRIYRGAYTFTFDQHHIISARRFIDIVDYTLTRDPDELQTFDVYYLECATDDCTGVKQAEANATLERVTSAFVQGGEVVDQVVYRGVPKYRLYHSKAQLYDDTIAMVDKVGHFYYHSPHWRDHRQILDWYVADAWWERILQQFSLLVLWSGLVLMVLGLVLCGWLFFKEKE